MAYDSLVLCLIQFRWIFLIREAIPANRRRRIFNLQLHRVPQNRDARVPKQPLKLSILDNKASSIQFHTYWKIPASTNPKIARSSSQYRKSVDLDTRLALSL